MIFSIYQLRDDPDWCIFDRELDSPTIGESSDYDCAGVFEVEAGAEVVHVPRPWILSDLRDPVVLLKVDSWRLTANAIRSGDFTDKESGQTAQITQLWPIFPEEG